MAYSYDNSGEKTIIVRVLEEYYLYILERLSIIRTFEVPKSVLIGTRNSAEKQKREHKKLDSDYQSISPSTYKLYSELIKKLDETIKDVNSKLEQFADGDGNDD